MTRPLSTLVWEFHHHRFKMAQRMSHWLAHFRRIKYVLIGDSLTEEGFYWGPRLGDSCFSAINLGAPGHTILQIERQLDVAARLKPQFVCVLAGTNDYNFGHTDEQILNDFEHFLMRAQTLGLRSGTVISIPVRATPTEDERLIALNQKLHPMVEAHDWRFLDINSSIVSAPDRPAFFQFDGIHFSSRMYQLWAEKLKSVIRNDTSL